MSLTSFLQRKDNSSCIKFQEEINKIKPNKKDFKSLKSDYTAFDTKRKLLVKYNLNDRNEASLIGIEFDYLARFRVAQIVVKNNNEATFDIAAENFFNRFKHVLPKGIFNKLSDKYSRVKYRVERYIKNKEGIDDKFIKDVFLLAMLEQCWRGNRLPKDLKIFFSEPSYEFTEELKRLLIVFEADFIDKVVKYDSTVKYNPKFGECSYVIGGADADIYIDGTLYDFKCTKDIGYKSKDAQQIIGYYILDLIAKKKAKSKYEQTLLNYSIQRVAIYSARIGAIYYFDINDIDQNIINEVSLGVEKILFNKDDRNKSNTSKKNKGTIYKFRKIKSILIVLAVVVLFFKGLSILNDKKDIFKSFINDNKVIKIKNEEDITLDFENIKEKSDQLLLKGEGFYYNSLISALRSYDINEIDNAIVVYELSDKLLNDMYKGFKINFDEDKFRDLTSTQLEWIDKKTLIEKSLQNNKLDMYKQLINMTLDKCEEWTSYYE